MNNNLPKRISIAILSFNFLILMHINIRNFGGPIGLPTAYLIWIGIVLYIAASIWTVAVSSRFIEPAMLKYLLLFICLSLLTVSFNPILDYHSFLYKTLGTIGGAIFFISLHQLKLTAFERDRLLFVIFISGVIEACIGIVQYIAHGHISSFIASTRGSIYGNFQQPAVFASYLATAIVISLFLVSRPLFRRLNKLCRACIFLFVAAIGFTLYLSNSKTGLIGMVLGVSVLLIARIRICKKIQKTVLCWSLALAIGITCAYSAEEIYFHRTILFTSKSAGVRILLYRSSSGMVKDKPILGCGFGNFGSKYLYYQKKFLQRHPEYKKDVENLYISHPDNEILYRLAESGIVGGVGLIVLLSAFGYMIFKLGREKGGLYLSMVLPIAFHTQVEYPLYQSAVHWMLFLILVYLPSSHFTKNVSPRLNGVVRIVIAACTTGITILMVLFLIRTLRAHMDLVKYNKLVSSKGQIRIELLGPALENSYLEQIATRIFMDARLRIALSKNKTDWIREYADWSKHERIATPLSALYVRESMALYALGKKGQAFDLVEEGLSLYPDKSDLLETKLTLITKEIQSRIKGKIRL
ncbi:MAG: O-antigen ligase C-terminal domain-containing protein [Nitrospirae bacterium]|nr:O-antigen ligase C-terminal domain-containing protein [Nitrospirota bacterium]